MELNQGSYLSALLERSPAELWTIFLLAMARIAPTIAIAPFFGGKMVANPMKLGLTAGVALIALPFLAIKTKVAIPFDVTFMLLLFKEVIIGAMLGILVSVPFYFAQGAGALIDHQRGAQSLQVMDPSTQMQTSPTGTLYNNMLLVIFFSIGGPFLFFDGLFTSFTLLPLDSFFPMHLFEADHPLWLTLMGIFTTVVTLALQLSAPALIGMLLSDLFLGIANRMAPQVQISFLLWSFKAFVGIAMLFLSWWLVTKQLDTQAHSWLKLYDNLVHTL